MIASSNDPHCSIERAQQFAKAWGSDLSIIANAGHINTASGHGPWPEGPAHVRAIPEKPRTGVSLGTPRAKFPRDAFHTAAETQITCYDPCIRISSRVPFASHWGDHEARISRGCAHWLDRSVAATGLFATALLECAEAATLAALMPVGTLLTPSRLFGLAILAPVVLLAVGSLASLLTDLLRRNQDH